MATVTNNPPSDSGEGIGPGVLIGMFLIAAGIVLFSIYGLPTLRGSSNGGAANSASIDAEVPAPGAPITSVEKL